MGDWFLLFGKLDLQPIFLAFLIVIYWIYVFIISYHLIRFGIGPEPKLIAFIFFIGSVALVIASLFFYSRVDLAAALNNFIRYYRPSLPF